MSTKSVAHSLLTDEERAFQDVVQKFMDKHVRPIVADMERDGRPPAELLKKMGEQGLLGSFAPEEYGGGGGSLMTRAIVAEETARADAGLDATLFVNMSLVARHLIKRGTEAQKQRYLVPLIEGTASASICLTEPHGGSDALSPKTTARRDGSDWIIDGSKTFITNAPIADHFLVFARTSGENRRAHGGTCFIVDAGTPGLTVGSPLKKMSLRSSPPRRSSSTPCAYPTTRFSARPRRASTTCSRASTSNGSSRVHPTPESRRPASTSPSRTRASGRCSARPCRSTS